MSKRISNSKDEASKNKKSLQQEESEEDKNQTKHVKKYPFKTQNFQHSGAVKSGKKKSWKSLKQIATSERSQAPVDAPVYLNIDSPPPLKPVRKYSDISGQVAKYTDPETGLYYSTVDEYKQIKRLPTDIVQGYLVLRNASNRI